MTYPIHPTVRTLIDTLHQFPPHAIILSGSKGVGLNLVASELANDRTARFISPATSKASPIIPVETIRNLYEQTRSRQTGGQYFIIEDADTMTKAAQSAFLKLLEEPGDSIHFILTSHHPAKLLPTVLSRAQRFIVPPITTRQSIEYLQSLGISDTQKVKQLLYIADGLPEELEKLATNKEYMNERITLVKDAKILLSGKTYEQLVLIHTYKDSRNRALQLIEEAIRLARRSLSESLDARLVGRLEDLVEIQGCIEQNANIRLQLTRFVV